MKIELMMNQIIWNKISQKYDKKRKEKREKMSKIDVRRRSMWKTRWITERKNLSKRQGQKGNKKIKGKLRNSRISESKKIQKIKEK